VFPLFRPPSVCTYPHIYTNIWNLIFIKNICENSVPSSHKTQCVCTTKINQLMLSGETVPVYSKNNKRHQELCKICSLRPVPTSPTLILVSSSSSFLFIVSSSLRSVTESQLRRAVYFPTFQFRWDPCISSNIFLTLSLSLLTKCI
jgi:hypothetical protein